MAFSGRPKIVILDETGSSLDAHTERCYFNLLKNWKSRCTILCSTHRISSRVEEIIDNVIILEAGEIKATGSLPSLKKFYGLPVVLFIVLEGTEVDVYKIKDFLHEHVLFIKEILVLGACIKYQLPDINDDHIETLRNGLRRYQKELGIKFFKITSGEFEYIYLRSTYNPRDNKLIFTKLVDETIFDKYEEPQLMWNRFYAMFLKRYYNVTVTLMLMRICLPALIILFFMMGYFYPVNYLMSLEMSPKIYGSMQRYVLLHSDNSPAAQAKLKNAIANLEQDGSAYMIVPDGKILEKFKSEVKADAILRISYLYGITFRESGDIIYYNSNFAHSPPIALNEYFLYVTGSSIKNEIRIKNHPLPREPADFLISTTGVGLREDFSMAVNLAICFQSGLFLILYTTENWSKYRKLQYAFGVSPHLYWTCSFLWDYVLYSISQCFTLLAIYIVQSIYVDSYHNLHQLFITLLVYGFAMLMSSYVSSYFYEEANKIMFDLATGTLLGFVFQMAQMAIPEFFLDNYYIGGIQYTLYMAFPSFALYDAVILIYSIHHKRMYCAGKLKECMRIPASDVFYSIQKEQCEESICEYARQCCEENLFSNEAERLRMAGVGKFLIIFFLNGLIYLLLLALLESKLRFRYPKGSIYKDLPNEDKQVKEEKIKIRNYRPILLKRPPMLIKNLTNVQLKRVVVNGICLELIDKEIFCMIGANGSGLSTIQNMLCYDNQPIKGSIYYNGYNLQVEYSRVRETFSYSAKMVTVKSTYQVKHFLTVLFLLRGYNRRDCSVLAESFAKSFGYLEFLDDSLETLSEGVRKRFSTSLAFIGNTKVLLLDKPVTGVDVYGKYQFYQIINSQKSMGKTIFITSTSLHDSMVLCNRFSIIVNGNMMSLCSIDKFIERHIHGYIIELRVVKSPAAIRDAQEFIRVRFLTAVLKHKSDSELMYHVEYSTKPHRIVRGILEAGKGNGSIVSYVVRAPKLRDVFEDFCKMQK